MAAAFSEKRGSSGAFSLLRFLRVYGVKKVGAASFLTEKPDGKNDGAPTPAMKQTILFITLALSIPCALRAAQPSEEPTNLWANRLIGDQKLPEKDRPTWTRGQFFKATDTLLPSGLHGLVALSAATRGKSRHVQNRRHHLEFKVPEVLEIIRGALKNFLKNTIEVLDLPGRRDK
jgi:hypothetical protein